MEQSILSSAAALHMKGVRPVSDVSAVLQGRMFVYQLLTRLTKIKEYLRLNTPSEAAAFARVSDIDKIYSARVHMLAPMLVSIAFNTPAFGNLANSADDQSVSQRAEITRIASAFCQMWQNNDLIEHVSGFASRLHRAWACDYEGDCAYLTSTCAACPAGEMDLKQFRNRILGGLGFDHTHIARVLK